MLRFKELSEFQQRSIMNHIATHPDDVLHEDYLHDHVSVEVVFPGEFFNELHDAEISELAKSASQKKRLSPGRRQSRGGNPKQGAAGDGNTGEEGEGEEDAEEDGDYDEHSGDYYNPQVRTLAWLHRIIHDFYGYRWKKFQQQLLNSSSSPSSNSSLQQSSNAFSPSRRPRDKPLTDDVSFHLFHFISKRFGFGGMVKKQGSEILEAVKLYRMSDLDTQLFGILLSSACYDTVDVRFMLGCWNSLQQFVITRQEKLEIDAGGGDLVSLTVTRSYQRVQNIPGLIRKILDTEALFNVQFRVRSALCSWCNNLGQFPGIVRDPNFYCPPFSSTNPYVGQIDRINAPGKMTLHKLATDEDRFRKFDTVVETSQLLLVLLLNFKQERLQPTKFKAPGTGIANKVYLAAEAKKNKFRAKTPPAGSRGDKLNETTSSGLLGHTFSSLRKASPASRGQPLLPSKRGNIPGTPSAQRKRGLSRVAGGGKAGDDPDVKNSSFMVPLDLLEELGPQLEQDMSPLANSASMLHRAKFSNANLNALKEENDSFEYSGVGRGGSPAGSPPSVSELEKQLFETVEKFGRFK